MKTFSHASSKKPEARRTPRCARRHAGQPPTAPLGGGFAPTRGRGVPSAPVSLRRGNAGRWSVGLILVVALTSAAPASARTLRDLPEVYEPLYDVAVADLVRKRCDSIDGRIFKGIGILQRLKRSAKQAGFTEAEIDAFVDSDVEKDIMIARARKEFAARGVDPDKPEDLCRFGREEIAKKSPVGELLRAK